MGKNCEKLPKEIILKDYTQRNEYIAKVMNIFYSKNLKKYSEI